MRYFLPLFLAFCALAGCGKTHNTEAPGAQLTDFGATYSPAPLLVGVAWVLDVPVSNLTPSPATITVNLSEYLPLTKTNQSLGGKSLVMPANGSGTVSFTMPLRYTPGSVTYLIQIGSKLQPLSVQVFDPIAN